MNTFFSFSIFMLYALLSVAFSQDELLKLLEDSPTSRLVDTILNTGLRSFEMLGGVGIIPIINSTLPGAPSLPKGSFA